MFNILLPRAKYLAFSLLAAGLATSISSSVRAALPMEAGYETNFDNLTPGTTLSGQDQWATNDVDNGDDGTSFIGNSNYVGEIPGYSSSPSDNWAKLGGGLQDTYTDPDTMEVTVTPIVPGQPINYLYRPFSLAPYNSIKFSIDFAITSSSDGQNKDTFGWSIRIGDTNYSTLLFTPETNTVYDALNDGTKQDSTNAKLDLSLVAEDGSIIDSTKAIIYDSVYHLDMEVDSNGNLTALVNGGDVGLTNQNVSNSSPAAVDNVAAEWKLTAPSATAPGPGVAQNGAGDNAIVFNNYSAVPEPSTISFALMAGLGALGMVFRHRSKRA